MKKRIKQFIEFLKFIEEEKKKASIRVGNGMMLF